VADPKDRNSFRMKRYWMSEVRSAVSFFLFSAVYFLFKRIKKMAVEKKERNSAGAGHPKGNGF